jgi:protein involved in polysaccharide export with SLBB domain
MRNAFSTALLLFAMGLVSCTPAVDPKFLQTEQFAQPTAAEPPYRIGGGDDIAVVLPFNPELNYEGAVGPDGRFSMPLAGAVPVGVKTVEEAEAAINQALIERRIVAIPHASVSIRHYSQVVYVGGEVKLPGAIPLRHRMDPLQAISVAGGLLDTARSEQVVVIRRGADGRPMLRAVNIDTFVQTGSSEQVVALQPDDTIFVPKSSIAEVNLWIDQYINKPLPFNRSLSYTINQNATSTVAP